jgi:hypothetical protein
MEEQLEKASESGKMGKVLKHKAFIPLAILAILALGTVLLGGIAVGGYLWYQSQKAEPITYSGPCDPRILFKTFTDSDWGYSISYPETWFIESYKPGEMWAASALPEDTKPEDIPYYMAAFVTLDGNFSPQFSEENELARLFLGRFILDPSFDLSEHLATLRSQNEEFGFGLTYDGGLTTVGGLQGYFLTTSGEDESWLTRDVSLDGPTHNYTLEGSIAAGESQPACLLILEKIQESFTLNTK